MLRRVCSLTDSEIRYVIYATERLSTEQWHRCVESWGKYIMIDASSKAWSVLVTLSCTGAACLHGVTVCSLQWILWLVCVFSWSRSELLLVEWLYPVRFTNHEAVYHSLQDPESCLYLSLTDHQPCPLWSFNVAISALPHKLCWYLVRHARTPQDRSHMSEEFLLHSRLVGTTTAEKSRSYHICLWDTDPLSTCC